MINKTLSNKAHWVLLWRLELITITPFSLSLEILGLHPLLRTSSRHTPHDYIGNGTIYSNLDWLKIYPHLFLLSDIAGYLVADNK